MKYIYSIILIFLASVLSFTQPIFGSAFKWFRIGKYNDKVVDSGDQGSGAGIKQFGFYYFNDFQKYLIMNRGWQLGARDWIDTNGVTVAHKIAGAAAGQSDENLVTMPLPDAEEITIRRYLRYEPSSITVDGYTLEEPFPMIGDEVNPAKIPGTADQMVESWIRTWMGITIHQKVYGWSQKNHDDYLIYDWTFINTGNIDLDDEIELPNQTLNDVYFLRTLGILPARKNWQSCYGEHPYDTLRMSYSYHAWSDGAAYDDFAKPHPETGYLRGPCWIGEATLHADSSCTNHVDDPSQPQMTGAERWREFAYYIHLDETQDALTYQTMELGWKPYDGTPYLQDIGETVYPGTHHGLRMDEQGYAYASDLPWWAWISFSYYSVGPYTMAPGDSFRIVFACGAGSITPETAYEIGRQWIDGTCTWDGPDNLPPPASLVYADNPSFDDNDKAKDHWASTGRDSLFKNMCNAQWSVRRNFEVPTPPRAPSIEVFSLPDRILIEWGNESEEAADFAGYRVYRAIGSPYPTVEEGNLIGSWESIFECGEGTVNALTHSYEDTDAERGKAYYYYVAAFDDGTHPEVSDPVGVNGIAESLESGRYLNRTTRAAYLTRSPGEELSDIRVVPNPFNVGAQGLQYPGEPDKIMLMGLPPYCTIKIYSESGDLLTTLEHTDGSGDEAWADPTGQNFMVTSSSQIVVSGYYIAHIIENNANGNPTGKTTNVPFLIVR